MNEYEVNIDRGCTVGGEFRPIGSRFESEATPEVVELLEKSFLVLVEKKEDAPFVDPAKE